jgi:hypothetical protein
MENDAAKHRMAIKHSPSRSCRSLFLIAVAYLTAVSTSHEWSVPLSIPQVWCSPFAKFL